MIELRLLEPDDWQLWRRLRLEALASAPEAFRSTYAEWFGPSDTEENWRARLAQRALNAVVSWHGEPAGMVSAHITDGAVELHSMWIAPHVRGHGLGDAAVHAVVDWATSNYPGLPVELSVKVGNASATKLYERNGFVDIGQPKGHPDERLMGRAPQA